MTYLGAFLLGIFAEYTRRTLLGRRIRRRHWLAPDLPDDEITGIGA